MNSDAAATFTERMQDVDQLMEIHKSVGGATVGRRVGVEVLNRSAVVLITAIWEGYCEELAAGAVGHLVANVSSPDKLPKVLRKKVAAELEADDNELAVWRLAGEGWRTYVSGRVPDYAKKRAQAWNTPMSDRIDTLVEQAIGLPKVTDSWGWQRMLPATARSKLDKWVKLRGDIAHGAGAPKTVQKNAVLKYKNHVERLVSITDVTVNEYLEKITGKTFL